MIMRKMDDPDRKVKGTLYPNPNSCMQNIHDDEEGLVACGKPTGWLCRWLPGPLGTSYFCTEHAREVFEGMDSDHKASLSATRSRLQAMLEREEEYSALRTALSVNP